MAINLTCDGIRRRDFLTVGALGTGLTLAGYLRLSAAAEVSPARAGKLKTKSHAKSAIFINLGGGPSHTDTFDLKPAAPTEYRGSFKPIPTKSAGMQLCEHLPKMAHNSNHFAILRSVTHTLAAHELGTLYVNSGNKPINSLDFPSYGAVVTKELPGPRDLPPFVAIPNTPQRTGFLGVQYSALSTSDIPKPGKPFGVRGISLGNGLTVADVEKRQHLLADLDKTFRGVETKSSLLDGLDRFGRQAYEIITSRRAREAFDVSRESPKFVEPYGKTPFGMSCLLATRLIESGVRFVTVNYGGWDTHFDNWNILQKKLLPPLDEGLSALVNGLESKGLLDSTVILMTGEFGRTPKINQQRAGRDHYPRAMSMVMAGGSIRGGQVIGATDDKGTEPTHDAHSPDDVAATFYHVLGIDPTKEYHTSTGRPVMIVREGTPIEKLLG
ncbi:MAG TPA: DUF1501 domain-containing protein [Planctomycetaceae bacterium]|jgi:hypothetical protein|nr:DUF1501 domain-containing protein [Planctomycetaceae bacterium]